MDELSALHETRISDLTQQDARHEEEAESIRVAAKQELAECESR